MTNMIVADRQVGTTVRILKETASNGSASLTERLLDKGVIFVSGEFNAQMSYAFSVQLLAMSAADPDREVTVYVNSPGGSVYDGLAMIDLCRSVSNPIATIGSGLCASMGALFLACAGDKGRRRVLPNCELMLHQPLSGVQGQATDIQIESAHIGKLKKRINVMLAESSGQPLEKVEKEFDRNYWLTADEAIEYGLVDEIVLPDVLPDPSSTMDCEIPVRLAGFVVNLS